MRASTQSAALIRDGADGRVHGRGRARAPFDHGDDRIHCSRSTDLLAFVRHERRAPPTAFVSYSSPPTVPSSSRPNTFGSMSTNRSPTAASPPSRASITRSDNAASLSHTSATLFVTAPTCADGRTSHPGRNQPEPVSGPVETGRTHYSLWRPSAPASSVGGCCRQGSAGRFWLRAGWSGGSTNIQRRSPGSAGVAVAV